jgi:hypothetical protein
LHTLAAPFCRCTTLRFIRSPQHPALRAKVKLSRYHHAGNNRQKKYSSYSFMTSTLDGGEWSVSHPGHALPPGKGPPVPIVQEDGWAPEPVWTQRLQEKSFAPAGDRISIARSSILKADTILLLRRILLGCYYYYYYYYYLI